MARFEEGASDDDAKVTGEMTRVLYAVQIKEMRRSERWPESFENDEAAEEGSHENEGDEAEDAALENELGGLRIEKRSDEDDYSSGDSLPPIEINRNRPRRAAEDSESSESDEE